MKIRSPRSFQSLLLGSLLSIVSFAVVVALWSPVGQAAAAATLQPAITVQKSEAEPVILPDVGAARHFVLQVTNSGTEVLTEVAVSDEYDPACLEFVSADPEPTSTDPELGVLDWDNVGPLEPGGSTQIDVYVVGHGPCMPTSNCLFARWMVEGVVELEESVCIDVDVPGPPTRILLPLMMKGGEVTQPTATPTATGVAPTETPTATPTATTTPQIELIVNTTDDSRDGHCNAAHCSLREAIDGANVLAGPDTITFNIPPTDSGCDAEGVCTIEVDTILPWVMDDGTIIDGFSQPGASAGPPAVIKIVLDGQANGEYCGITIFSADNVVQGLSIGNFTPYSGIYISGPGAVGNQILNNYIGTDPSGMMDWGNCTLLSSCGGVWILNSASNNTVGPDNLIVNNGRGIWVTGDTTTGNTITRNSISDNDDKGIDVFNAANGDIANPIITAGTGTQVSGTACANCTVEIFSDDEDEGQVYEGTIVADATGDWTFVKPSGFQLSSLTATATDADGNTSEFSAPWPLP